VVLYWKTDQKKENRKEKKQTEKKKVWLVYDAVI